MTKYHLTLIICVIFTGFSRVSAQNNNQILWYDKPAAVWPEALPIGNSYMGAMIFGDAQREHIQFNESTLYSGEPDATFKNINVRKYY
ncbi:MAG: glycoside hydrolase family 95 protein, partial [Arcicella sp.]|nr:glycoside hydrolase family 95 protein [Arcicella sp.]